MFCSTTTLRGLRLIINFAMALTKEMLENDSLIARGVWVSSKHRLGSSTNAVGTVALESSLI